MLIERFLADDPGRLTHITRGRTLTNLRGAAHLNIKMPTVLRKLGSLGLPIEQTDAATTSWNRHKLNVSKSHVASAAALGHCVSLRDLPQTALTIARRSRNRRRFRVQVNANGIVRGKAWRDYARLNPYQRAASLYPDTALNRRDSAPSA